MTDRLKLSDPTGDAEVDKIAVTAEQEDRIQQLRKNIAALQSKLAKQTANAATSPAPAANNKIGARKHGSFKAISTAPSINLTPHGPTMVPVPYPVVQDLSSSVNTGRTVKFNGCPVYLLDASTQPKCTGDEQGTGKGIKSGTVSGEVKPIQGSSTVRVEGKQVVREGDACTMNGGNCPGIYVTTPLANGDAPKEALATSNPPYTNKLLSGNGSAAAPQKEADPLGLFATQTPAARLAAEMTRNTLNGNNAAERMKSIGRSAASGPLLVPWDPKQSEAQRARTTNSLNIALLGPFGAPGAATRLFGGSEKRVADANDVGAAAMGVAWTLTGMPSRQVISVGPRTSPVQARTTSHVLPPVVTVTPIVGLKPVAAAKTSTSAGVKIVGTGAGATPKTAASTSADTAAEIDALRSMARKLDAYTPGLGERALKREQYRELISKYRNSGAKLQAELDATIAGHKFVYRATTLKAVEIYRANGRVSGRVGGVYMSAEYVGLDPKVLMDRSQVFEHWGQPEVLLRIPTSEIDTAVVPRPFGGGLKVGWEPRTAAYPAAGSGDMHQFLGSTKSWSDSWVIPLKGTKTK